MTIPGPTRPDVTLFRTVTKKVLPAGGKNSGDGRPPSDVTAVEGVLVSRTAVAELVEALNTLERWGLARGKSFPPRLRWLRGVMTEATCARTCVDASPQVVSAQRVSPSESEVITPKDAAAILETTEANVRYLCNHKRLDAMFVAGRWLIAPGSVESYRREREEKRA